MVPCVCVLVVKAVVALVPDPTLSLLQSQGACFLLEPIEPGDECIQWCAVVVNAHLCEKFMLTYTVYKIYMYISLHFVYLSCTCTHWL